MSGEKQLLHAFSRQDLAELLPYPAPDAHKYSRGRLLLIAGSDRYPGAACLTASAAQRMGAGYTQVFAAPESVPTIQAYRPSLVVSSWQELPERLLASAKGRPCALVIGPGLTVSQKTADLLASALRAEMPVLIDGGALATLASDRNLCYLLPDREAAGYETILTPHAGEAQALAEPFGLLSEDPVLASRELSDIYHALVLLKGPDTYVTCGEDTALMEEGTAALAKAGSGDVLAGMVGALLAQGIPAFSAAYLGAYLHAAAGSIAAAQKHEISVIPEDIVEAIPQAIAELAEQA